jgi:hypothetical protein
MFITVGQVFVNDPHKTGKYLELWLKNIEIEESDLVYAST